MGEDSRQVKPPPAWLRALGRGEFPATIYVKGRDFTHERTYKHDFFAATALYEGKGERVVLKMGRIASLFGVPLIFVGVFLARREARLLNLARGIKGIPECPGIVGKTGLVRGYVEGAPLKKGDRPNDEFFPRLSKMLDELHAMGMAYVDLEKPENILLGIDGRPYLIDFQISWHVKGWIGRSWLFRRILGVLQTSDRYHLMKHWRKLRPDQLDPEQFEKLGRPPFWIRWHRRVFRPVTVARRHVLVWLGARESARGRSPG